MEGLTVLPSTSGVRSCSVLTPQMSGGWPRVTRWPRPAPCRRFEPWAAGGGGPDAARRLVGGGTPRTGQNDGTRTPCCGGAPNRAIGLQPSPPPKGSCSLLSTPYCRESSRHEWVTRFSIPTSYMSPGTEDALCWLWLGAEKEPQDAAICS